MGGSAIYGVLLGKHGETDAIDEGMIDAYRHVLVIRLELEGDGMRTGGGMEGEGV